MRIFLLTVALDGATVSVLEPDDGSGWVKVCDTRGNDGLVPATYLGHGEEDLAPTPTPSSFKSPGKEQGSGQYGKRTPFALVREDRLICITLPSQGDLSIRSGRSR